MKNVLLLAALLTGCLDSTDIVEPVETEAALGLAVHADSAPAERDVCAMLPANEGACSVACDPDALGAFIPAGACIQFVCTLTDGSLFRTGGCRGPGDDSPIQMMNFDDVETTATTADPN